jgi:hypothetical protein
MGCFRQAARAAQKRIEGLEVHPLKAIDYTRKFGQLQEDFNHAGTQFVLTELELAVSLIQLGESCADQQRRSRSYQRAEAGYQTAVRILPRIALPGPQREKIFAELQRIRALLQGKGLSVEEDIGQQPRSEALDTPESFPP